MTDEHEYKDDDIDPGDVDWMDTARTLAAQVASLNNELSRRRAALAQIREAVTDDDSTNPYCQAQWASPCLSNHTCTREAGHRGGHKCGCGDTRPCDGLRAEIMTVRVAADIHVSVVDHHAFDRGRVTDLVRERLGFLHDDGVFTAEGVASLDVEVIFGEVTNE